MANKEKGLIFYKLESDYNGDYTKRCGLTGNEIDGNFHFLRGMDISEISLNPETSLLELTRLNGEKITLKNEEVEINNFKFEYDNNILKITYPGGIKTKSFDLSNSFVFGTSEKITGDGTLNSPIDIDASYLTGTYRPAIDYIDLTLEENHYPNNIKIGDRYLTKEKIRESGLFYTYDEVKEISKALKECSSQWRVPTIEDWNLLLNSMECESDRNHGNEDAFYLNEGKMAGKMSKSNKYWEKWNLEEDNEFPRDWSGLSILPVGGQTGLDINIDGLRKYAILWSITEAKVNDTSGAICKKFDYNKNTVGQINSFPNLRFPLRLVKDYNGYNNLGIESILGSLTKTKKVEGINQIWTSVNVYFSEYANMDINNALFEDIYAEIPEMESTHQYFIGEWDGKRWHKIPFKEGESVVLTNPKDKFRMHEWRLVDDVLTDTTDIIRKDFEKEFSDLNERISTEELNRYNADLAEASAREEAIKIEADARYNADLAETSAREEAIRIEAEARLTKDQELDNKILAETSAREEAIKIEADARYKADLAEASVRENAIKLEAEARIAKDNNLDEKILAETSAREEAIRIEAEARLTKDQELNNKISEEVLARKEGDENLREVGQNIKTELDNEIERSKKIDKSHEEYINENKVINYNNDSSLIITPGKTENGITTNTTIKINLPSSEDSLNPEHLKTDEDGLFFDGFFGTF